jgi:hypothetical protein
VAVETAHKQTAHKAQQGQTLFFRLLRQVVVEVVVVLLQEMD